MSLRDYMDSSFTAFVLVLIVKHVFGVPFSLNMPQKNPQDSYKVSKKNDDTIDIPIEQYDMKRKNEILMDLKKETQLLELLAGGVTWNLYGDTVVDEGKYAHYNIALSGEMGQNNDASIDIALIDITTSSYDHSSFTISVKEAVDAYTGPGIVKYDGRTLTFKATHDGDVFGGLHVSLKTVLDLLIEDVESFTIILSNPQSSSGAAISLGRDKVMTVIRDAHAHVCLDDPQSIVARAGLTCSTIVASLGCEKDLSALDASGTLPTKVLVKDPIICPASCQNCPQLGSKHPQTHHILSARAYCNALMLQPRTQCISGLNFLGVGFDASKAGNDDEAYSNTEAVVAFDVSKWNTNDNILPEAKTFIVPDKTQGTWDPHMKDTESQTLTKWNSAKQISSNFAAKFGIKKMLHVGKSSKAGLKYKHALSLGEYIATNTHKIELGSFSLHPEKCSITPAFKESVEKLPYIFSEKDPSKWLQFFDLYGTHYVHSFSVGGALTLSKKINSCSEKTSIAAEVSQSLEKEGKKTAEKSGKTKKESSAGSNSKKTEMSFIGGGVTAPQTFREEGWEGFKKLVGQEPDLIECKVHSLSSLFPLINQHRKMFALQKACDYYMKLPAKNMIATQSKSHQVCGEKPKRTKFYIMVGCAGFFFMILVVYYSYIGWMKKLQKTLGVSFDHGFNRAEIFKYLSGDLSSFKNLKGAKTLMGKGKGIWDKVGGLAGKSDLRDKKLWMKGQKVIVKDEKDAQWRRGVVMNDSAHPMVKIEGLAREDVWKFIDEDKEHEKLKVTDWVKIRGSFEKPHHGSFGEIVTVLEDMKFEVQIDDEEKIMEEPIDRKCLEKIDTITLEFSSLFPWQKKWGFTYEGSLIKEVIPGGIAYKKGLRVGWRILTIDGGERVPSNTKLVSELISKTRKKRRKNTTIVFRKDPLEIDEVRRWLCGMGLECYTDRFDEHGYKPMATIYRLQDNDIQKMIQCVKMKHGDSRKIVDSLKKKKIDSLKKKKMTKS